MTNPIFPTKNIKWALRPMRTCFDVEKKIGWSAYACVSVVSWARWTQFGRSYDEWLVLTQLLHVQNHPTNARVQEIRLIEQYWSLFPLPKKTGQDKSKNTLAQPWTGFWMRSFYRLHNYFIPWMNVQWKFQNSQWDGTNLACVLKLVPILKRDISSSVL